MNYLLAEFYIVFCFTDCCYQCAICSTVVAIQNCDKIYLNLVDFLNENTEVVFNTIRLFEYLSHISSITCI